MEWLVERIELAGNQHGLEGTWLRLAEDLLRSCRDRLPAFNTAMGTQGAMAERFLEDVERETEALLSEGASGQVHPMLARQLSNLLQHHADRWPGAAEHYEVLATRAVALAIDQALHEVFRDWFRDRGLTELRPGHAYPVHRYNLLHPTRLIGGQPNSRPENLSTDPAVLPHLRLADDHARDFRYVLDWDAYGRLAPLAQVDQLTMSACQPNLSLDEFETELSEDPPAPTFRNHGPRIDGHGDVLLAQLQTSVDAGAHVIVFPEYTVGMNDREALLERLQELSGEASGNAPAHSPVLVVAGTCEVPVTGGTVQNQACLWMPRGGPTTLVKCIPAVLDGHVEDIDPGDRTVRVFMTDRWAIAVLICRDALESRIVRQLEDIGVNLVLIPAMTPKTGSLVGSVVGMPARCQAFVVVAVAPAMWPDADEQTRVQACFHGPYEEHPEPLLCPGGDEPPARRGVWVFGAFDRTTVRYQVPEEG